MAFNVSIAVFVALPATLITMFATAHFLPPDWMPPSTTPSVTEAVSAFAFWYAALAPACLGLALLHQLVLVGARNEIQPSAARSVHTLTTLLGGVAVTVWWTSSATVTHWPVVLSAVLAGVAMYSYVGRPISAGTEREA